jgi:hypothetical protein
MFLYFGEHYERNQVGARLVRVECAHCGCEYFYQLTRIGIGRSMAPYYLFRARAAQRAVERAQRDIKQRLERDTELVPCPKCHWINEDLVVGYRRSRYKSFNRLAFAIIAIGIVVYFVIGFFLALVDPAFLLYALVLPLGMLLIAGGMMLVRTGLRSRIQPNRNYPLPPTLPAGSPPALFKDPTTGQLAPAKVDEIHLVAEHPICEFQIGRHTLPEVCCDCLKPATSEHGHKSRLSTAMVFTVARCEECANISKRAFRRAQYPVAMVALLASAAILVPLNLDLEDFCILSVIAVVISLGLSLIVARKRTAPVTITHADRSRSVVKLRFRNPEYARLVNQHLSGRTETA